MNQDKLTQLIKGLDRFSDMPQDIETNKDAFNLLSQYGLVNGKWEDSYEVKSFISSFIIEAESSSSIFYLGMTDGPDSFIETNLIIEVIVYLDDPKMLSKIPNIDYPAKLIIICNTPMNNEGVNKIISAKEMFDCYDITLDNEVSGIILEEVVFYLKIVDYVKIIISPIPIQVKDIDNIFDLKDLLRLVSCGKFSTRSKIVCEKIASKIVERMSIYKSA